ncbi:uncharacterized protein N7506_003646 [Penicillium brevicompactum]|uniref:uncharacterized protein n=1 Tax=Penicillium brevicompactum TaxID=5074 RepID=UPI00254004D4|nr:uncharacterized protein N7506_003646 [Penicillium brevicompactum]KAJ5343822.1 hypothetical protein N7506_003646 [Penicillium brevicompactum]
MDHDRDLRVSVGRHWHVLVAVLYDLPAALSVPLQEHLGLSGSRYAYLVSALYTAYAAPNTILPFFSGIAVDRIGEKLLLFVTLGSVLVGQLIFSVSAQLKSPPGMILGRIFIGLGGEIVGVLGSEITTRWFKDKQLSLALAMVLSISRLGSVATSFFIPGIIDISGVVYAVWFGSLVSSGVAIAGAFYLLAARGISSTHHNGQSSDTTNPVRQFPLVFWKLALICVLGYGGINTFPISAQRFLAKWFYGGDQRKAGAVTGIPYFLSGALVPLFGLVMNMKFFQNYPLSLCATNIMMGTAHLLLLYTAQPIMPLSVLGVAYALYGVAFWAALARSLLSTVESKSKKAILDTSDENPHDDTRYGTIRPPTTSSWDLHDANERTNELEEAGADSLITLGYGIMTSLNNLSTAVVPIFLAKVETLIGFKGLELVFIILSLLGLCTSFQLLITEIL